MNYTRRALNRLAVYLLTGLFLGQDGFRRQQVSLTL